MPRKKKETTEQEEEIKKAKPLSPFDIIKMMFTNQAEFSKLSDKMLERNSFMINRVFSIKYPLQARYFNNTGVVSSDVVKSWNMFVVKNIGLGRVPGFVYTKSSKSSEANKEEIDKELKREYCKHYNISYRDFDDMMYFYHDWTVENLKYFEKINSKKEAIKKQ